MSKLRPNTDVGLLVTAPSTSLRLDATTEAAMVALLDHREEVRDGVIRFPESEMVSGSNVLLAFEESVSEERPARVSDLTVLFL